MIQNLKVKQYQVVGPKLRCYQLVQEHAEEDRYSGVLELTHGHFLVERDKRGHHGALIVRRGPENGIVLWSPYELPPIGALPLTITYSGFSLAHSFHQLRAAEAFVPRMILRAIWCKGELSALSQRIGLHLDASSLLSITMRLLPLMPRAWETARWCSEAIGRREVIRPIESETAGPKDLRDAISVSYQRKEESLVLASEIQQLPVLQGYLSVAGYDVAAVTFPMLPAVPTQAGFIPRAASDDTSQTPPLPVATVPSAQPRLLVMKPLPAKVREEHAIEEIAAPSAVSPVEEAPTQQLALFPGEQKRKNRC